MIIRPAVDRDNEALCRLELMAAQGTTIRITEDRRDFFARARLFPGSILLVAEDDRTGRLIGVFGGAPVRLRLGGQDRTGGMLFDFRADPERKTGMSRVLYNLWRELEERMLAAGAEFIYGLVKDDNPANSIYRRMGVDRKAGRTFWTLPVYRRKKTPPGISLAVAVDAAAEYRESAGWYGSHDFWPLIDDPGLLQRMTDRYMRAKISYGDASLKIWDGTVDYDRVVTAGPWIFELARPLAAAAGRVIPLPRIPRLGQRLRTWYVYDILLPYGSRALRPMLAAANNLALERQIDFLVFTASEGEPELAAGGRGSLATLGYGLVVKEYRPIPRIRPPIFFDIRMI